MTPPRPNDEVSAFFDGELSPSEHESVTLQLSRSVAAQTELMEIRRLSEALRTLPAEPLPLDFHAGVMNRILPSDPPPTPADSGGFSQGIFLSLKCLTAVAALVLIAFWIPSFWPSSQPTNSPAEIAANSSPATGFEEAKKASPGETSSAQRPRRVLLGSEGEMLAENQNRRAVAQSEKPPQAPPNDAQQPRIAAAMLADAFSAHDKNAPNSIPLEKEILQWANAGADRVVLVEITADDPQQTLAELQKLLAQNSVPPAKLPAANFEMNERKRAENEWPFGLYVQSSAREVSSALGKLRATRPAVQIQSRTALAVTDVPNSEQTEDRDLQRKSAVRFRQSLAQSLQKYQAGQAGFGGASQSARETPSSDQVGEQTPAIPQAAAPNLNHFNRSIDLKAAAKPGGAATEKSFQMIVPTSNQTGAKKNLAASPPPKDQKQERGQAKQVEAMPSAEIAEAKAAQAPIRLMFIFQQRPAQPAK